MRKGSGARAVRAGDLAEDTQRADGDVEGSVAQRAHGTLNLLLIDTLCLCAPPVRRGRAAALSCASLGAA